MAAKAKKVKRTVVLSLLDKLGAEYTAKIALDRAIKKLERHFAKKSAKPGTKIDITPEEREVLEALNLILPEAESAKKKSKKAPAKKSKAKKEAPAKAEPKAKKTPKPKADWMDAAVQGLLKGTTIEKAEEHAMEMYLAAGGRDVPKLRGNAKINVSRAKRVLLAIGKAALSEDGKTLLVDLDA